MLALGGVFRVLDVLHDAAGDVSAWARPGISVGDDEVPVDAGNNGPLEHADEHGDFPAHLVETFLCPVKACIDPGAVGGRSTVEPVGDEVVIERERLLCTLNDVAEIWVFAVGIFGDEFLEMLEVSQDTARTESCRPGRGEPASRNRSGSCRRTG